jgi:hypothetical protein
VRYTQAARLVWWHNGLVVPGCRGNRAARSSQTRPCKFLSHAELDFCPRDCIQSAICRVGLVLPRGNCFGFCRWLPIVVRLATVRRCCQCSSGTIGYAHQSSSGPGSPPAIPAPTPAVHTPPGSADLSRTRSKSHHRGTGQWKRAGRPDQWHKSACDLLRSNDNLASVTLHSLLFICSCWWRANHAMTTTRSAPGSPLTPFHGGHIRHRRTLRTQIQRAYFDRRRTKPRTSDQQSIQRQRRIPYPVLG